MRILVVSAHFPPNFVSGGTTVPQRLARGLQARGHDVVVYAGYLDATRAPLETWMDRDKTGLRVRWIVTTPWTVWSDPRNYDNPEVTGDFTRYLDVFRPDVVHLHSLQSLGAGLVTAAKRSGATVVVTAHDFWWCCGRQFLVDREYHPCPLVVASGCCCCERTHDWLLRRNRVLATALADADVVLAPSAGAVAILKANGVDPSTLAVDENGFPIADVTPIQLDRTREVRVLYTGGSDPMKGVQVLFGAARLLADVPDWCLIAHGADEWLTRVGFDTTGLPLELRPPYGPDQLDTVLSGADLLVVPSVMRESHSLVTREALVRGMPVVCTETIGPEEVIVDGSNGLLVPPDDAHALAHGLRRIITEDGLLERLRPAPGTIAVRSLDDQLDGLERRYEKLRLERIEHDGGARRVDITRVLFVCGIEGAPLRYRARLPAEALALHGVRSAVRHYLDPQLPRLAERADAVVMYRVPATPSVLELARRMHIWRVPLLFDVDDLIFDPDVADEIPALTILPPAEAELWLQGVQRYRTTMEACDVFVASTAPLARHAQAVAGLPVERFDNGVGIVMSRLAEIAKRRPRSPGPHRIGYFSGTDTHDRDWASIEPAVIDVLDRRPSLELWLGGKLGPTPALERFGERVRRLPTVPWQAMPGLLRDLDVNLSPMQLGSRFNESKSAIKWLEAALVHTATVASPTEPFEDSIRDGITGLLATEPDDWARSIDLLLDDDDRRARMGRLAGREALLEWGPTLQGRRYLAILERAVDGGTPVRARRASGWDPVVVDEHPTPKVLEPYGRSDGRLDFAARSTEAQLRYAARSLLQSIRDDGAMSTARKVGSSLRRRAHSS
jgi:glycosyltransferase involved in cell wall biosynthesis